jgi:hypothetical protein
MPAPMVALLGQNASHGFIALMAKIVRPNSNGGTGEI